MGVAGTSGGVEGNLEGHVKIDIGLALQELLQAAAFQKLDHDRLTSHHPPTTITTRITHHMR
jgi:hypothetical protein